MNPRFEDLMYRAGLTAQGCWDQMDDYDRKAIEKLTELIVRECVAQCEINSDHSYLGAGSKISAFNIKQHFGVEE